MLRIPAAGMVLFVSLVAIGCAQGDVSAQTTTDPANNDSLSKPLQESVKRIDVAGWAAVSIAVAAWLISVLQVWVTRNHNRKSLLPHLQFFNSLDRTGEREYPFGLFLNNSGTGPPIIDSFELLLNMEPFSNKMPGPSWRNIWTSAGCRDVNCSMVTIGDFFQPGDLIHVVSVDGDRPSDEQYSELNQALKKVEIKIHYRTVYGEKKTASLQEYMSASSR